VSVSRAEDWEGDEVKKRTLSALPALGWIMAMMSKGDDILGEGCWFRREKWIGL
jgi:hypothetical protein